MRERSVPNSDAVKERNEAKGRGGDCGCVLELRQRQREMVETEISRRIWSKCEPHPISKLGPS